MPQFDWRDPDMPVNVAQHRDLPGGIVERRVVVMPSAVVRQHAVERMAETSMTFFWHHSPDYWRNDPTYNIRRPRKRR